MGKCSFKGCQIETRDSLMECDYHNRIINLKGQTVQSISAKTPPPLPPRPNQNNQNNTGSNGFQKNLNSPTTLSTSTKISPRIPPKNTHLSNSSQVNLLNEIQTNLKFQAQNVNNPPFIPNLHDDPQWQLVEVDGYKTHFYRQKQGMECGPSCVSMICKLYGKEPDQSITRALVGRAASGSSISNLHNFEKNGAYMIYLSEVLNKTYDLKTHHAYCKNFDELKNHLFKYDTFSRVKPGILEVEWYPQGSGRHVVVCLGRSKDNQEVIILDPGDDKGWEARLIEKSFPDYKTPAGSWGILTGGYLTTYR